MKFSVVKKGYDQNEVHRHIAMLEKELNELRGKEDAISKSFINAEIAALDIVECAEDRAKRLREETREEINEELNSIEKMIASEKRALDEFCSEYDAIVKNYFTGSAVDITAPLKEKIGLLESIIKERRMGKLPGAPEDGEDEHNDEDKASGQSGEHDTVETEELLDESTDLTECSDFDAYNL